MSVLNHSLKVNTNILQITNPQNGLIKYDELDIQKDDQSKDDIKKKANNKLNIIPVKQLDAEKISNFTCIKNTSNSKIGNEKLTRERTNSEIIKKSDSVKLDNKSLSIIGNRRSSSVIRKSTTVEEPKVKKSEEKKPEEEIPKELLSKTVGGVKNYLSLFDLIKPVEEKELEEDKKDVSL